MSKVDGAKVTESVMMVDRETGEEREVDWLLERTFAGVEINIAIECRAHKRKGDVTWIDQIVGKYKSLDVDRVIAVANSGFTRGASKKAAKNRIECKTLLEAESINWPNEFIRIGLAGMERVDACVVATINGNQVAVSLVDESTIPAEVDVSVETVSGDVVTLHAVVRTIYGEILREIATSHYKENFRKLFPTLVDCKKQINLTFPKLTIDVPSVEVVSLTGTREPLNLTEILLVSVFDYKKSNVEHLVLSSGDAMVSKGIISFPDDEVNGGTDVTVVQSTNSHETMSVRFQKTDDGEDA